MRSLGVRSVACVIGGSLGGMQTLEWAATAGATFVKSIITICCGTHHHAWQIAISAAQRQAIYADPNWNGGDYAKGKEPRAGLSVARQMAMVSYRSHEAYEAKFGRKVAKKKPAQEHGQLTHYDVEGYLRYQGEKFFSRFDALSYVKLTRTMDTHDLGRGRGGVQAACTNLLTMPALVVGVSSDALYPPSEQRDLMALLPKGEVLMIESPNGHDGFLLDYKIMQPTAIAFLQRQQAQRPTFIASRL